MQYRKLGTSDLTVSRLCLGTMTWGAQNSFADAARQMDMALDHGVNFLDTAEIYPIPAHNKTVGQTEQMIGRWLACHGGRDRLVIATKMVGPSELCRGRGLVPGDVAAAVDGSLRRLGTDVIDLYQLHWPQRQVNCFSQRDFQPHLHGSLVDEDLPGMLDALARMVDCGKIREIGVSNETPWGIMTYLRLANEQGLPRIQTCQNPYNLLQRSWDVASAEIAQREGVDLLAYSPLAGGVLSGKYLNGAQPVGARFTTPWGPRTMAAGYYRHRDSDHVRRYCDLARAHGMTPTQLAVAFVTARPFVGSNIIGATTCDQLAQGLLAADIILDDAVLEAIETLHDAAPSPSLTRTGMRDHG